jgi:hypothetical protein
MEKLESILSLPEPSVTFAGIGISGSSAEKQAPASIGKMNRDRNMVSAHGGPAPRRVSSSQRLRRRYAPVRYQSNVLYFQGVWRVLESERSGKKREVHMGQGRTPGLSQGKVPQADHANSASEPAIRDELQRVLASHEFRSSKRSQEFLRYVIEHTLNGQADTLKERTIGIDVFGRSATYDPSDDATVRVKAGEVRKRLGLYYAGEGAHSRLKIELPAGTYVPEFRHVEPEVAIESRAPAPAAVPSRKSNRTVGIAVVAIVGWLALGAFLWLRAHSANPVLDQFWAPVLEGTAPVSLCAAYTPNVYGRERDLDPTQPVLPEDFVLLPDQFVGGGDLVAVSRISAMLTRMQRAYRVRIGAGVSFHDLRTSPAILVGYSYTRWKEISSQLRFFIDAAHRPLGVTDNGAPTKWTLPNLPPDRHTNEDYAIVTRVFHPDTHAMLVEIAGITQYGTDAASDLLTNPDLLAEALHAAPAGWQKKNLQIVLHVKVISGAPGSPTAVAIHSW